MKTLFQNYCSVLSTEAMYMQRCLQELGQESHMWSEQNQSVFDTFDMVNPEVFITHFRSLSQDALKYLAGSKKIDLVLNVTGASDQDVEQIQEVVKQANINMPLMFTNLYDSTNNLQKTRRDVKGIYPAADVFIPNLATPPYKLDTCFFALDNNELLKDLRKNEKGDYHVVSFNPNHPEDNYCDMTLDVTSAVTFYDKYKKSYLVGDINFVSSQILFDSILKSDSVKIKVPDQQQKMLDSIFATLFKESEGADMTSIIKSQVKSRHNCFRRTARLARLLKNNELSSKLERRSDNL